jgi:hypothetical protein
MLRKLLFENQPSMCRCIIVQMKQVVSHQFFWIFPPQLIHEMRRDPEVKFCIYSTCFWYKFVVDANVSIACKCRSSLTFAWSHFMQAINHVFFIATLPYASSNHTAYEGNSHSKTQHFICAYCYEVGDYLYSLVV